MIKSVHPVLVTRFFQLVTSRKFTEAEEIIKRLNFKDTEWNRGYFVALRGMVAFKRYRKEQDQQGEEVDEEEQKQEDVKTLSYGCAFFLNIDLNNKDELERYRQEFLVNSKDLLLDDYDRGFFSAWADYMRILIKSKKGE